MKDQDIKKTALDDASIDQCHKQATCRSNCYGMLAAIFRDTPTPETITQLRNPPLTEALNDLGCDITQYLTGDIDVVTQDLREQYTQTFIGPGNHISLYASMYCEDGGQLWGDSTVWVKQFIEATGLSFKDNWDSIPDHITIELELMQRLTDCEAQLWGSDSNNTENTEDQLGKCLNMQDQFLNEHLCLWIPKFCERVLETSTSPFYREIAKLTKSLILSDADQVKFAKSTL